MGDATPHSVSDAAEIHSALRRLKQQGCSLLVCGEAPESTYQEVAKRFHGEPSRQRFHSQVLTGESNRIDAEAWLPDHLAPDSPQLHLADYRVAERSSSVESHDGEVVSPLRAGPSYLPLSSEASEVTKNELEYESRGGTRRFDDRDEVDIWEKASRPTPGVGGKRPRGVKPRGIDPDPSYSEVRAISELREEIIDSINRFDERKVGPIDLRLGVCSIDPIVRTIGECRTQVFIDQLMEVVREHEGMLYCQFPHPVISQEAEYLREHFDLTVLVRHSLCKGDSKISLRYIIPAQKEIADEDLISGWVTLNPTNGKEKAD